ncbi:MAG: ASCH domain-containing protein [Roseiarcus sp.]|jgi:hypothetical protein
MTPPLALSIRQPWAWAILYAGKDVENRSWPTRYRGRVLIHAGLSFEGPAHEALLDCAEWARDAGVRAPASLDDLTRGGIVGEAEIVDCVESSASPWFFGPYGFALRNARPLPFQPCRGKLGFFSPSFAEV